MRASVASTEWSSYIDRYHADRPGITEDVLSSATDEAGRSPYDWLVEPVRPGHRSVLDIGCGSAPFAHRLAGEVRYLGVDRSAAELRRARAATPSLAVARADAGWLPLRSGQVDAVAASMMLMLVTDVDAVLAEVSRVLRPGGTLVATVPTRPSEDDPSTAVFGEVLAALGQTEVRYPGSLSPSRLAGAGLELVEEVRGRFTRAVVPEQCRLVVDSFYAVGAGEEQVADAVGRLQARAAAGPFLLTYPLRRLVAVRRLEVA